MKFIKQSFDCMMDNKKGQKLDVTKIITWNLLII